jgi:hypothetical protein
MLRNKMLPLVALLAGAMVFGACADNPMDPWVAEPELTQEEKDALIEYDQPPADPGELGPVEKYPLE